MRLVLFDFDGTLTQRDTLMPFLRHAFGTPRFLWGLLVMSPVLAAYALKLMRNDVAKERLLSHFVAGLPIATLREMGSRFETDRLPSLLREDTMALLAQHRKAGDSCVIVSASLDLYLAPWSQRHGFTTVLCSRLETQGDQCATGRLLGQNCFGPEKARRILHWLDGRRPEHITAYGDSRGDQEMLEMADARLWCAKGACVGIPSRP